MLAPSQKPKILWTLPHTESAAVPESIRLAILAAARDEGDYAVACQLFAGDAGGASFRDEPGGRLEHAVARTLLDAWLHGMATTWEVGGAYADLAFELRERKRPRLTKHQGSGPSRTP